MQKFRSTFVALQEHIDTYLDKQETALIVSLCIILQ